MTITSTARNIFFAAIAVGLVLFLPWAWWPFMVGKIGFVALCLLVAGVAAAVALARQELSLPTVALVPALLPVAYLLSYAASSDKAMSLLGSGIDADSVVFVVLAYVALVLGAMLVRDTSSARTAAYWFMGAIVLAGLVQLVVLTVGLPGPFSDRSFNLIGKWNDFALALSALLFFLLIEIERGSLRGMLPWLAWAGSIVILVVLGLVNFLTVWAILLCAALGVAAVSWVSLKRMPWASITTTAVCVLFLFFGPAISGGLAKILPASSLEVRPALQTTIDVVADSHGSSVKNAALGTGPNTFGRAWLMHKPQDVNSSVFWNLDFAVGFSTVLTAFGSVGLLGAIAWLIVPILLMWGLWRTREQGALVWGFGGASLMLWAATLVYVPSPSILLLMFALSGVVLGLTSVSLLRGRIALAAALLVALLSAGSGILSVRRAAAQMLQSSATLTANAGNYDGARTMAQYAANLESSPEVLRLRSDIAAAAAAALASATSTPQTQAQLQALLSEATQAGLQAIAGDPMDYRSYLSLARLYDFLARNKVEGALLASRSYYESAAARSPLNPSIPLSLARLEAAAGTSTQILERYLNQALTLKPDYTDAILFVVQLDIARNDLPAATRDATAAVRTAPGVASLWFQLGVLYYTQNDTKNAALALEQAVKIEPTYANAQYFLGLSYAAEGRTDEAKGLFMALVESNPTNAEVRTILSNLEAGKPALGATTTPPVTRPQAPIQ